MTFSKKLRFAESVVFIGAFVFIMYNLITTYGIYIFRSIKGKGYLGAIIEPVKSQQYYISLVSVIVILNTTLVLWEIGSFFIQLFRLHSGRGVSWRDRYIETFGKVTLHYKSSFLAMLINQLLPKLVVVHMFWVWLPHFKALQLFTVNMTWYSWLYGYLCWEFSTWIFHYTSHRIRLLWCFHAQHHGPSEMNMTVNWIHFFAESYYSTLVRLFLLTLMGVNPLMFGAVIVIDSAWGTFTHVSERVLADGRLGFLRHFLITPAHHRVHHSKNRLYLDTNFAFVLPFWDWVFGTLQPIRDEVKADYGVLRDLDVTNFSDLYFGEMLLLYQDVKNAVGFKNKILFIFMPPGWDPAFKDNTASALRQQFLKVNADLGLTSRVKLVNAIRSRSRRRKLTPAQEAQAPDLMEAKL